MIDTGGFSLTRVLSTDGGGNYDFGGGYDFGSGSFGDFGGGYDFGSGAWDLGNSADWTSWQSEPPDPVFEPRDTGGSSGADLGSGSGADLGSGSDLGQDTDFKFYEDSGVRQDFTGSFPGDFAPETDTPEAQGQTYQNPYLDTQTGELKPDTSFDPTVGAPGWWNTLVGVASILPTPLQPFAAAANVLTQLYNANQTGTSYLPSLSGVASLLGQPLVAAGIGAANQYSQGNTLGAGLNALQIAGAATGNADLFNAAGQIGSGINAYNAYQGGDYITSALSAVGAFDPGLSREVNSLNALNKGIENNDLSSVLAGAAGLSESSDLQLAAQGSKLIDAASKSDWGIIDDIASDIKSAGSGLIADAKSAIGSGIDTLTNSTSGGSGTSFAGTGSGGGSSGGGGSGGIGNIQIAGGGAGGGGGGGGGTDNINVAASQRPSVDQYLAMMDEDTPSRYIPTMDYDLNRAFSAQRRYAQAAERNRAEYEQLLELLNRRLT